MNRARIISIVGLISLMIGLIMEIVSPDFMIPVYECVKGICLGLAVGALVIMVLFTTGLLAKIRKNKLKQKHMKKAAVICVVVVSVCLIASIVASMI